jgi:hypothetical protein
MVMNSSVHPTNGLKRALKTSVSEMPDRPWRSDVNEAVEVMNAIDVLTESTVIHDLQAYIANYNGSPHGKETAETAFCVLDRLAEAHAFSST